MFHIHLISDSTGETLFAAAKAATAAFPGQEAEIELHQHVFTRTAADLARALDDVTASPGPVFYTLADAPQRAELQACCAGLGMPAVALLDPMIAVLSEHLGKAPNQRPGGQHQLDADYFARIEALDFAITHDDGNTGARLARADVILVGVSRTSKTPTCIYLAYRGTRAANVPLVPGREPPPAFFEALKAGIPAVGLTASPSRLAQIRGERIQAMGASAPGNYAELDQIRREVADARLFFERHAIPVIDVTRRSIEETAAAILAELRARREG